VTGKNGHNPENALHYRMWDDYPMAVAYSETISGVEGKPVLITDFRPPKKILDK
jgi:hypothetical protein